MPDASAEGFLICACWIDQRFPGTYLSKLYAARTADIDSAIALVRELRPKTDKVKDSGENLL